MNRWEAWVIRGGFGLASASGLLLGVFKYFVAGSDPDSRVGNPAQPVMLAAHVLAAPAAVFAMGLLLRGHVLPRIRRGNREGRATGLTLLVVGLPLVFSGYFVQVFTGEIARHATGWLHAGVGVFFAATFLLHMPLSRSPDDPAEPPPEPEGRGG